MTGTRALVVPAALLALSAGLTACGTSRPPSGEVSWPAVNPRVRLERVVRSRSDLGRGLLASLSYVLGAEGEPLFERPFGVAWLGGDLLVTDPAGKRVSRITRKGGLLRSTLDLKEPVGVAACACGIVVADSRGGRVALLDDTLRLVRWLAEGLSRPTGVACEGGEVFVVETEAHRILVLDGNGTVLRRLGNRGGGPGELNFPVAIWAGGGELWIGDTLNARLQRLRSSDGKSLGSFGTLGDAPGETPRIKGISRDGEGNVWVTDALLDRVCVYDENGALLLSLGRNGTRPGELAHPAGIAVGGGGLVAVADSLNRRIQLLRLLPVAGQAR